MKVIIDVSSFYDWVPCDEAEAAEVRAYIENQSESITASQNGEELPDPIPLPSFIFKPDHTGIMLKRVLIDTPSHTEISIPQNQIEQAMNAIAPDGKLVETEERAYCWLIGLKVMPHHAPQSAWLYIHVDEAPELEEFLNQHFELGVQA